jgi:hypothetical protein
MIRKLFGFFVFACFVCALPAMADITYTITGPSDFNLTFTLPPNPQQPDNPLHTDSYGSWGFNLYPVNTSQGQLEVSFYIDGMCVGSGNTKDADPECGILSLWTLKLYDGDPSSPNVTFPFSGTGTLADVSLKEGAFLGTNGAEFGLGDRYTITATETPEPSSLLLLGTGALGMIGGIRRRFI